MNNYAYVILIILIILSLIYIDISLRDVALPTHPPTATSHISNITISTALNMYAPPPFPSIYTIIIVYKIVLMYSFK